MKPHDDQPIIITIDGPSGVGKGTMAQMLAKALGFSVLDSGALYRAVALNVCRLGLSPENAGQVSQAIDNLELQFTDGKTFLHQQDVSTAIRDAEISDSASKVAAYPVVRNKLLQFMQNFAKPPGLVADGRDMGTVVFPQAQLKLFLTATPEIRAKRRNKQLKKNGKDVKLCALFSDLIARDQRDRNRAIAPLEPAKDAVLIDTNDLSVTEVFAHIQTLLQQRGITP